MQKQPERISLVIPVYNNEKNLPVTYRELNRTLEPLFDRYQLEFVFVDDGSRDNSFRVLTELRDRDPEHVKVAKLTRNFGQVMAIMAGFQVSTGDAVVVMSADLQDPPELILQMVHEWHDNDYKIVLAARQDREDGVLARAVSRIFYNLTRRFAIPNMPRGGFDFFLIDRVVKDIMLNSEEKNSFLQGQVLWVGYRVKMIPYTRRKREIGKSTWTLSKKIKYFIDGFMTTTYFPIRVISGVGIAISTVGFLYALLILILKFLHNIPVEGWAPLMIVILLLSGFQMIMLGVIGEYLWRTYDETRKRPTFIIEKILDNS